MLQGFDRLCLASALVSLAACASTSSNSALAPLAPPVLPSSAAGAAAVLEPRPAPAPEMRALEYPSLAALPRTSQAGTTSEMDRLHPSTRFAADFLLAAEFDASFTTQSGSDQDGTGGRIFLEHFWENQVGLFGSWDFAESDYLDFDQSFELQNWSIGVSFRPVVDDWFRMPCRIGYFETTAELERDSFTSTAFSWKGSQSGLKIALEPEVVFKTGDPTEQWSIYGLIDVGTDNSADVDGASAPGFTSLTEVGLRAPFVSMGWMMREVGFGRPNTSGEGSEQSVSGLFIGLNFRN